MSDLKLREAFDSDSVPLKNIALRKAHDHIEKLEAGEIEFDRIIGGYASENARFRDRIEKLEAALANIIWECPHEGPEDWCGDEYCPCKQAFEAMEWDDG